MTQPANTTTREAQILRDRIQGLSYNKIAERHGLTLQGARFVVTRETRRMIDQINLDILTSHATGEIPVFLIPEHAGPDFDIAMDTVQFVCKELVKTGTRVHVVYRTTYNGLAIGLEDADPPPNSKAVSGQKEPA